VGALLSCLGLRPRGQNEGIELDDLGRPDITLVLHMGERDEADRLRKVDILKRALRRFSRIRYDLNSVANDLGYTGRLGGGACLGIALQWSVSHIRAPEANRLGPRGLFRGRQGVDLVLRTQEIYETVQSYGHGNADDRQVHGIRAALAESGIAFDGEPISTTFSGRHVSEALGAAGPGHHIVSLLPFVGVGHTLSIYRSNQGTREDEYFHVFDPNGGEFDIRETEVEYFFDALRMRYYMEGDRYSTVRIYRVGE
jgi:hypothetical protein